MTKWLVTDCLSFSVYKNTACRYHRLPARQWNDGAQMFPLAHFEVEGGHQSEHKTIKENSCILLSVFFIEQSMQSVLRHVDLDDRKWLK